MFLHPTGIDIFPWTYTLNLAFPVAAVLTLAGQTAVKLTCCANTAIDTMDMDDI